MSAESRTDDIVHSHQEEKNQDPALITDPDVAAHIRDSLKEVTSSAVIEESEDEEELVEFTGQSIYYDVETMAPMNAFSAAAIARLRAYKAPTFPLWDRLPARRRAAVLILLYADRWGDLRVVITMRAASLRSFSGHAALPGGKADSKEETPYHIARREAFEEIGLPLDDLRLPAPFRIEELCSLPPALARTSLVVTPCVAFLHADRKSTSSSSTSPNGDSPGPDPAVEDTMIPRLDAREVAAVFSASFYNFLKADDLPPRPGQVLPAGHWYDGSWLKFKEIPWRVHNFHVPVNDQRVARPRRGSTQSNLADKLGEEQEHTGRFKVWGMTGRILVDAARIAYGEEPEMEHNSTFGDEDVIMRAEEAGEFEESAEQERQRQDKEKKQSASENGPAKM